MSAAQARTEGKRKTKVGRVVSDKMDKTIVVSVERLSRHRLYKRVIRLTTRFKAHDERNEARIGDTVRIEESRPLSATKRWRLVSVTARAGEHGLPGETVVSEEAEVTEAIHSAAHPGRAPKADAESQAGESGAPTDASAMVDERGDDTAKTSERGDESAKTVGASDDEQGESPVAAS